MGLVIIENREHQITVRFKSGKEQINEGHFETNIKVKHLEMLRLDWSEIIWN